jgi:hypothetical protein
MELIFSIVTKLESQCTCNVSGRNIEYNLFKSSDLLSKIVYTSQIINHSITTVATDGISCWRVSSGRTVVTFKVDVKRSTLSGISTTTTTSVLVSCTDAPVCSSVHVSNTGGAWQYILMKYALQESECLRTSNREATSPGRARFDDVTAMLAADSGLMLRATLWQCPNGCWPLRGTAVLRNFGSYPSAARNHIQADFNPEIFTAVASARLNVEPLTLTRTFSGLRWTLSFWNLFHLPVSSVDCMHLCDARGIFFVVTERFVYNLVYQVREVSLHTYRKWIFDETWEKIWLTKAVSWTHCVSVRPLCSLGCTNCSVAWRPETLSSKWIPQWRQSVEAITRRASQVETHWALNVR